MPVPSDVRLLNPRFPRANAYNPEWLRASASSGSHVLWLAEWLTSALDLRPGMRVLDLGCGRAMSSVFLHREFGVQVWATDLWFSATENLERIRHAGAESAVFPVHADSRTLPFAEDFFDAIVSIDSFYYYGTDDLYLNYVSRFVKPGGSIAIAGAGFLREIGLEIPPALQAWWEPSLRCLHSAAWWRDHWAKTGLLDIDLADSMPDGWKLWLEWQKFIAPDNLPEIQALETDAGEYLGFNRCIGRRRMGAKLEPIISSIPPGHTPQPLLR